MITKYIAIGAVGLMGLLSGVLTYLDGPDDPFPYADRVPADAPIYIAVPDLPALLMKLDEYPEWKKTLGIESLLGGLEEARPYLKGPAAFYATLRDGRLQWTAFLHLTDGSTHVEGEEYRGEDSMARVLESFRNERRRPHVVLDFDALPSAIREVWGEFSHAILEIDVRTSLRLRGKLTYRPGRYGDIVENRIHAAPVPQPGHAALAHSGLTSVADLLLALDMKPSIPDRILKLVGPAWGVEIHSAEDITFWFEARQGAEVLDGHDWKNFRSEVRDGRWIVRTKTTPRPGSPNGHQATTRIETAPAVKALRALLGERGEPVLGWLERVERIESKLDYRSDVAVIEIDLKR